MSKLDGSEPKHWHDENGRHRMPDPRRLAQPEPIVRGGKPTGEMSSGVSKATICTGDPDLARYWDHLDAHDRLKARPERQDGDSAKVRALFDKLEGNERESVTLVELITALRAAGK